MFLEDLDYKIPQELIALYPKKPRDESNLIISGEKNRIVKFKDLLNELKPNDALVFNDTKVIKADFDGVMRGKKISINLNKLEDINKNIWSVFIKTKKKIIEGDKILFFNNFNASVKIKKNKLNQNIYFLEFDITISKLKKELKKYGRMPIPLYIKKRGYIKSDSDDYQTVFAKNEGAVAAPTASLHFTKKLIKELKNKKIKIIKITLHVNGGTFLPIKTKNICDHQMYYEEGNIPSKSADEINNVKKNGGKIIAVGTTVLRLLESSKNNKGFIKPFSGQTNIFIKPGWKVDSVDGIITNFHTPKSTLLLLIYSLIGKNKTLELYKFAIRNKLRFFSYGDACLIWNKND